MAQTLGHLFFEEVQEYMRLRIVRAITSDNEDTTKQFIIVYNNNIITYSHIPMTIMPLVGIDYQ